MNYLAHIYLSGTDQGIQIGNFIGDFVKGKAYENYPDRIREGILLHRFIDNFTDNHPAVIEAKALLREFFGRYAGVLLDMFYDHFLAQNFGQYATVSLSRFSRCFYWAMICHYRSLPERVQGFAWHFISTNRLCKYASIEGLQQSLDIMIHYKPLPLNAGEVMAFLQEHHSWLRENFQAFFPELKCSVQQLQILQADKNRLGK